ncbi:uncharacterized protein BT62DRAFT_835687, partial [Guyanagaster necrorhizus]
RSKREDKSSNSSRGTSNAETSFRDTFGATPVKLGYTLAEETASQASTDLSSLAVSHWNTDTGASRHMTPHRQWFRLYAPHVVPIRLADNSVIYSAGIGSVVLEPEIQGEKGSVVELLDTLHVPAL